MTVHVSIVVIDTGYCTARSNLVATGTGWQDVECHAPAFLLRHPNHGVALFDTGYAPRLFDAFRQWPDRLYKYATPTTLGRSLLQQLVGYGVTADDVRTVIVSHLHADHVAGLRDFRQAAFVVSQKALALQQRVRGVDAVRRGILQSLFPENFAERATPVDQFSDFALPYLGPTHDLFRDGSVRLVSLPGHATGQIGALVHTARGDVLLCADGAWTSPPFRELRPPHWITGVMQDDAAALRQTLRALHDFALVRPDVAMLPTHCPETLRWTESG